MPTNILSGDTVTFDVRFHDVNDATVTPSSATITVTYLVGGASIATVIPLILGSPFWQATWSTVGVDVPSDATYVTASDVTTNPASTGQLRIIDP